MDVRTLPFVRFEGNEAHSHRRFGLNLGGINGVSRADQLRVVDGKYDNAVAKGGDVGGVGPDPAHPLVVTGSRVWASSWAFHAGVPCMRVDGLDVYECEYGVWRTRMDRHEYRDLSLRKVGQKAIYHPWGGSPDGAAAYEVVLGTKDDRPPVTVITRTRRAGDGTVVVSGTTSDNGAVKRVTVNGRPAKPTRDNFAEWEAVIVAPADRDVTLTATAEDAAGNVESCPHVLPLPVRRR